MVYFPSSSLTLLLLTILVVTLLHDFIELSLLLLKYMYILTTWLLRQACHALLRFTHPGSKYELNCSCLATHKLKYKLKKIVVSPKLDIEVLLSHIYIHGSKNQYRVFHEYMPKKCRCLECTTAQKSAQILIKFSMCRKLYINDFLFNKSNLW